MQSICTYSVHVKYRIQKIVEKYKHTKVIYKMSIQLQAYNCVVQYVCSRFLKMQGA